MRTYSNCFYCEKSSETKYCANCSRAMNTLCVLNKKFIAFYDGNYQFGEETVLEKGITFLFELEGEVIEKIIDPTTVMSCELTLLRKYELPIYVVVENETDEV